MSNFNKPYNLKIVSIVICLTFLFNATLYSYPLSKDSYSLRIPIGEDKTKKRIGDVEKLAGFTKSSYRGPGEQGLTVDGLIKAVLSDLSHLGDPRLKLLEKFLRQKRLKGFPKYDSYRLVLESSTGKQAVIIKSEDTVEVGIALGSMSLDELSKLVITRLEALGFILGERNDKRYRFILQNVPSSKLAEVVGITEVDMYEWDDYAESIIAEEGGEALPFPWKSLWIATNPFEFIDGYMNDPRHTPIVHNFEKLEDIYNQLWGAIEDAIGDVVSINICPNTLDPGPTRDELERAAYQQRAQITGGPSGKMEYNRFDVIVVPQKGQSFRECIVQRNNEAGYVKPRYIAAIIRKFKQPISLVDIKEMILSGEIFHVMTIGPEDIEKVSVGLNPKILPTEEVTLSTGMIVKKTQFDQAVTYSFLEIMAELFSLARSSDKLDSNVAAKIVDKIRLHVKERFKREISSPEIAYASRKEVKDFAELLCSPHVLWAKMFACFVPAETSEKSNLFIVINSELTRTMPSEEFVLFLVHEIIAMLPTSENFYNSIALDAKINNTNMMEALLTSHSTYLGEGLANFQTEVPFSKRDIIAYANGLRDGNFKKVLEQKGVIDNASQVRELYNWYTNPHPLGYLLFDLFSRINPDQMWKYAFSFIDNNLKGDYSVENVRQTDFARIMYQDYVKLCELAGETPYPEKVFFPSPTSENLKDIRDLSTFQ